MEAKPCPCCRGPASIENTGYVWTVRCTLSCEASPEAEALQRDSAVMWWNRLVSEYESEVA